MSDEKLTRKERAELKEQARQEKHDTKKNGARNVCRFGFYQSILSFLALIVFIVAFCICNSKGGLLTVFKWILAIWLIAEIFISYVMWFLTSRLKKKYDDKGEILKGLKSAFTLNRAYAIGGAIPTAIVLIIKWIISLF